MLTNFVNYSIILLLLSYLAFFRQVKLEVVLLLAIISLVPFFLPFILPAGFISDVLTFTHYAQRFRSDLGLHDLNISENVFIAHNYKYHISLNTSKTPD